MTIDIFIKIIAALMLFFSFCFGQTNLENNLNQLLNSNYSDDYSRNYIKGYMQPFVNAFGTTVSGGMYHRAAAKEFPGFDFGINTVYVNIPGESKLFYDFQNNAVPTVFGSVSRPVHDLNLPGGTGINSLFIPQLQLNLGLASGFEATARYMSYNIDEFGDIALIGLGVKYGFGEFVPLVPIELSAQAMYHKFTIGEWLDSGTFGMNLQMSKDFIFLPIGLYWGIGFENTAMIIKTGMLPGNNINDFGDISIEGENRYRFNLGLSWTFTFFNLHADYNIGKYNSVNFGAMIVF